MWLPILLSWSFVLSHLISVSVPRLCDFVLPTVIGWTMDYICDVHHFCWMVSTPLANSSYSSTTLNYISCPWS
jgi:hypothetical protein